MHEIGTLYKVIQTVEEYAAENHVSDVLSVTLDVGELSGMLPYFFEEYFPMVIEGRPALRNARLILKTTPGIGHCNACGENYNVAKHEGLCPYCGSYDKKILTGRGLVISNITVAIPEAESA